MTKYIVKKVNFDFKFQDEPIVRGSRRKRLAISS